ncbi:MAG: PQQ-binding-like beta-propeller repeat protein [Pirellulaceae bacterium]
MKSPRLFIAIISAAIACGFAISPALGQIFERPSMLSPAEVDLLDSAAATHLESAKRFLAEKQWEEAVDAIRRVMEADAGRLVKVPEQRPLPEGFERLIPAREFCQWRLSALAKDAPEALAHYRKLVDPLAERWLAEFAAKRDEKLLKQVLLQAFASSSGDEALLRLADATLERGEFAVSRYYLERILGTGASSLSGAYPDSDIPAAEIRARLVLVSILEDSLGRGAKELAQFKEQFPEATGRIAGKSGNLADTLTALLAQASSWPAAKASEEWGTFAGNQARSGIAKGDVDIAGKPLWTFALPRLQSDREWIGAGKLRVAEDMKSLLSYNPAVYDGQVLQRLDAGGKSYITSLSGKTGEVVWQVEEARRTPLPGEAEKEDKGPPEVSDAHEGLTRHLGVARYTLTVQGHKLFARIGSPVTSPSARRLEKQTLKDQGWIMGLDLRTQGKPLDGFPLQPESTSWSFEGTPVADESYLYVAMRRIEQGRCQMHIACFDLPTTPLGVPAGADENYRNTGRLKWRTKLCSGTTPSAGDIDEISHVLLSLDSGMLFCNTNLGAVAAVSADDGRIAWVVKYPRAAFRSGNPDKNEGHFFRDLNPCLVAGDLIIVAPSDCERIFALRRGTGALAWTTAPGVAADAMHLLGCRGNSLICSGDYLYWLDLQTGAVQVQYPAPAADGPMFASPNPRGFGRGVLAGDHVYWPTRENILVFHQSPRKSDGGYAPPGIKEIPLFPRGAVGGNLVIAEGKLFLATGDKLMAFGEANPIPKAAEATEEPKEVPKEDAKP